MEEVRVLTQCPISLRAANDEIQHAPLVVGRFGSVTTRLVLDTGSEVHLLTKELVDELGLALEPGEEGTDHSGATVPSWSVENVAVDLAGMELTLRDAVAIPAPKPFHGWGIGGILSPQHLHPTALIVIDLVSNQLLLVEDDHEAVRSWLLDRHPSMKPLVLPRDATFTSIVVRGAIRPHPEIPTMLNTGGKGTEFAAAAVPGLAAAAPERIGGGVGGSDVIGALAGAATLVVSGNELPVDSLAVRETMHDPQGLIGMDVLRGTVLVVAADVTRPVLWLISAR